MSTVGARKDSTSSAEAARAGRNGAKLGMMSIIFRHGGAARVAGEML